MWHLYYKPGMFKVSNIFCWIKTSYELANISLYFCINFGDLKLIFHNIDFPQHKSKLFIELKYVCLKKILLLIWQIFYILDVLNDNFNLKKLCPMFQKVVALRWSILIIKPTLFLKNPIFLNSRLLINI